MSDQLPLEEERRGGEIGQWWIATQRPNETQRTGVGAAQLRATLEHLRKRGDRGARYLVDVNAGWVHVTLGALPVGGAS